MPHPCREAGRPGPPRAQGQQWLQASRMKRGQGVPSQWEAVLLHLGGEDETGRSPRGTG